MRKILFSLTLGMSWHVCKDRPWRLAPDSCHHTLAQRNKQKHAHRSGRQRPSLGVAARQNAVLSQPRLCDEDQLPMTRGEGSDAKGTACWPSPFSQAMVGEWGRLFDFLPGPAFPPFNIRLGDSYQHHFLNNKCENFCIPIRRPEFLDGLTLNKHGSAWAYSVNPRPSELPGLGLQCPDVLLFPFFTARSLGNLPTSCRLGFDAARTEGFDQSCWACSLREMGHDERVIGFNVCPAAGSVASPACPRSPTTFTHLPSANCRLRLHLGCHWLLVLLLWRLPYWWTPRLRPHSLRAF